MQRCVKIATKSVYYFRRFEVMNELAVTFIYIYRYRGQRGSVVVKALYYKPEGRGFDTR
jgi:hypothetical protein